MRYHALARDTSRVRAYTSSVPTEHKDGIGRTAAVGPHTPRRRRRPSWQEQKKREAWGQFWAQVNKGAMSR